MKKTILILFLVTGCTSLPKPIQSVFQNEPPADPKEEDVVSIDPLQMQSQADYHFAMGETYSLEGLPQKAAEQFKLTLLYDPESPTVRMKLASEYVKMGLVSEAITQVEYVVGKNGKDIDAHLMLGSLYSSIKVYEKAEKHYNQVVLNDPERATEAKLYLGAVYAEQDQFAKSIKMFEEITKDKNKAYHHLAHYYIGRILDQTGEHKKGIDHLQKSLQIKNDFDDAVIALGSIYERDHQREKAKKLYSTFQDQFGPNVEVAKSLAQLYLEDEDYEKAYNQYEIIQASEPLNLNVKVRLALILIEKKDYEKAIYKLKEILALSPDSDKVRFYLAAVYEELKEYPDAIAQFRKIEPASQFYGEASVHAAYLTKLQGDTSKAIDIIEDAISKKSDYSQFYALYASLLDDSKDYAKAEKVLLEAVKKFPTDDQLHFFLGSVQDKLGKRKETIENMKKVIALNEKHFQALNYLAYTYAEMDVELDFAEDLSRRALALNPGDAFIKDTVGWVLYKKGKISEAVKILEAAHQTQPNESIIAEHLGDAYYQYQLFQKARDMYEKAVSVEKDNDTADKLRTKIRDLERITSGSPANRSPASATGP